MSRKARRGEVVCRCGAYRFPHRMMGGRCDGGAFVDKLFAEQMYGACRDCMFREYVEEEGAMLCQVLQGRETTMQCPELESFVSHEGIKLYGVNRPPKKGPIRFRR
jgi:hypothetical protein